MYHRSRPFRPLLVTLAVVTVLGVFALAMTIVSAYHTHDLDPFHKAVEYICWAIVCSLASGMGWAWYIEKQDHRETGRDLIRANDPIYQYANERDMAQWEVDYLRDHPAILKEVFEQMEAAKETDDDWLEYVRRSNE